jgi:CheY-like chemotaxis protein
MDQQPIVIIEDDQDDQEVLREVLTELQVSNPLHFFDDCEKAFQFLLTSIKNPFLILCDINLPRMDGIQFKRKIDSTESLRKKAIPFVFLTTSEAQLTVNQAYTITNLQGYFQKSATMADIKQKVKLILDYWSTALHPQ